MNTPSIDGDVWGHFLESDWTRRPGLVQGVVGEGFVTEEDIFSAALEAARENRGRRRDNDMRIFVKNATLASNLRNFVPVPEDRSFEGYAERLRREYGIHEFGLQIDHVQARNPAIMAKVIPVFQRVWRHAGIPMTGAYVDAFIGNYARTPFGVHRDPLHDFMFMIKGERRMRLWSPEAAAVCGIEERELDYDDHVGWALEIDGRRDSIIYWPPSYWHVGESPGLSVSMNVNFLGPTRGEVDWTHIEPLLGVIRQQERCRSLRPSHPFSHFDSTQASGELPLPQTLCQAIDGIREACASEAFGRSVVAEWLAHISRHGFQAKSGRRAPDVSGRLADSGLVRAVPTVRLYWARHEGAIVWACQGRSGELRDADAGERLLRRLLNGGLLQVDLLLAESATGPQGNDVKALLEELVTIGALEHVGGPRAAPPVNGAEAVGG